MKLDDLTPTESVCYEDWNGSDHMGGDCDTQGYAWAAWDEYQIIIMEDDHGFVDATTYTDIGQYVDALATLTLDDERAAEREAMAWNYPE